MIIRQTDDFNDVNVLGIGYLWSRGQSKLMTEVTTKFGFKLSFNVVTRVKKIVQTITYKDEPEKSVQKKTYDYQFCLLAIYARSIDPATYAMAKTLSKGEYIMFFGRERQIAYPSRNGGEIEATEVTLDGLIPIGRINTALLGGDVSMAFSDIYQAQTWQDVDNEAKKKKRMKKNKDKYMF